MKKLDPNAKVLFYLTGMTAWLFFLSFITVPFFFIAYFGDVSDTSFTLFTNIDPGLVIFLAFVWSILIPLPTAYLSYENYRYGFQPDSIVIETGIIWKKNVSIPYERVQNIDILRGPLARLLGLSDLQIQTAGSSTQLYTEGRIPGVAVEEANKLKDEILAKVSRAKNQGL